MPVYHAGDLSQGLPVGHAAVEERLRVALDRGQRSPELVRYVRHEVLLYRLEPLLLRYVLEKEEEAEVRLLLYGHEPHVKGLGPLAYLDVLRASTPLLAGRVDLLKEALVLNYTCYRLSLLSAPL